MPLDWNIAAIWPDREQTARRLGVSPLLAQLLLNRGLCDTDRAQEFLNPSLGLLLPPEQLPGATEAARLLAERVRQKAPITLYADYDVDGITGAAILWHTLRLAGAEPVIYIPHRLEEGYGLNSDALRAIRQEGADTVVSIDCGITAAAQATLARELGLTLIITDHHALPATLPDACALVHPRLNPGYANPDLCGAGVALKLAWALARELTGSGRVSPAFRDLLVEAVGLTALGTIADVVPLVGENRILARYGLLNLANSQLPGIKALIASAKLDNGRIESDHVGFWLAPRLNAAGRMGHARLAAELLTSADEPRAREIALYLEGQNQERKKLQTRIFNEARERIEQYHLASDARRAIVLADPHWHAGVIGIVAARVVEEYRRPTVLIALEGQQGQGSARSVRHFALDQALTDCSEHLLIHGGHAMAAGLRIAADRVEAFTAAFVARANQQLTAADLHPALQLDAECGLHELTEPIVRQIESLAPFGQHNPRPRLASAMLDVVGEPRIMGRTGEHLGFQVSDGRITRRAVAFRQAHLLPALQEHRRCRLAFEPQLNHFNHRTNVELNVLDMQFPTV